MFFAKAYYDTNTIEVKYYQIKDSPLAEALAGLKVAFLTDLHISGMDVREKKILEMLSGEKPDLIFLSGDYITFKGPYEPVTSFFRQLKAPRGIYAVFGNTEYSNENGSCVLCHHERSKNLKEKQTPIFLRNSTLVFEVNHKKVNLAGVDDPVKGKSDLKRALKGLNPHHPTVLLAHSPEVFEEAASYGTDLILCGHNHGGQIFLTKYLWYVLPLDPVLDFLEGFFQKGKTLMYVSRGIGTSYLPFRLGVKPEITFFEFTNDLPLPSNLQHLTKVNPSKPIISNHSSQMIFAGLSLSNLLETFDIFGVIRDKFVRRHSRNSNVLLDFESDEDLKLLNWECHKWFELSEENATSGKHSLKVSLPPGQYPGINFEKIKKNWSGASRFEMDVFNPSEETVRFHIRIDDHKSGWAYANRFDINFELKQGMNHISIPADSIRTNVHRRPLNLKRIERMMVFIPNNPGRTELFIDNIRLE
ncbi:MAG: metallophosphoesterase [Thermodesulfobacteriota bacterium]